MIGGLWWERWPGRWEAERKALESAGIKWERDEAAFEKGEFLILRLHFPWHGNVIVLKVIFPPEYPYFRPEVFAQPGTFTRHQNPIGGNLCLLARSTQNWNPEWTLAELLNSQFPLLARAATTKDRLERETIEEPLGEPVTTFLPYALGGMILVDSSKRVDPKHNAGKLMICLDSDAMPTVQGAVADVRAQNGEILFSFDVFSGYRNKIPASWVRLAEVPFDKIDPREFEKELRAKKILPPPNFTHQIAGWFIDVVGLLVPEELQQGEIGDGWIFLVRVKKSKTQEFRTDLVRAGRAGRFDFNTRIPSLAFLNAKHVAIVGLGSIGAPVALELARSGAGKLSLIDYDFVEAGSVVRWPLGKSAFGVQKTHAIDHFVSRNYPFTKIETVEYRFGVPNAPNSSVALERSLFSSDLIIDATAEVGIHQFLSDYARENKKPFVYGYLTTGGYGGLVACFDPSKKMGCWYCLQMALLDEKTIPEPPFAENADVQPVGCAERTSIFPGFDAKEISLQVVRTAVSALSDGSDKQYPKASWDVAIAKLSSQVGGHAPPSWNTYAINHNPQCRVCK
jgi:molybdopterin/thiamine biosynthesis adenylyltransferase/ubiquitin-protein ligase